MTIDLSYCTILSPTTLKHFESHSLERESLQKSAPFEEEEPLQGLMLNRDSTQFRFQNPQQKVNKGIRLNGTPEKGDAVDKKDLLEIAGMYKGSLERSPKNCGVYQGRIHFSTFLSATHPNETVKKCYAQMEKIQSFFETVLGEYPLGERDNPMNIRLQAKCLGVCFVDTIHWNPTQKCVDVGVINLQVFAPFEDFLDLLAHEFSHGYLQHKGILLYKGESGALNESIADIMGIMTKHFHADKKKEKTSWLFAEGFLLDNESGGMPVRSFAQPGTAFKNHKNWGNDPQVNHMRYFNPNGDVHINSGIPNHAFYLASNLTKGSCYECVGKIWHQAIKGCKKHTTFREFALLTCKAAEKLFPKVLPWVQQAWEAVGVDPQGKDLEIITRKALIDRSRSLDDMEVGYRVHGKGENTDLNQRDSLISKSLKAITQEDDP